MSVMGPDGKILQPGGGGKWWSPYGDTDEEREMKIQEAEYRIDEGRGQNS